MTIRYYILPEETGIVPGKGPKYLKWRFDPDPPGLDIGYIYMSYGLIPAGLVCANVTSEQHDILAALPDVAAAPENIDQTIGPAAVGIVQNVLETLRIPAEWVDTTYTYRDILRRVAGLFQLSQAYKGMHGDQLITAASQLDLRWNQIPTDRRANIQATADALGYTYADVTNQWTARRILMYLGNQWGNKPFVFQHKAAGIDTVL